MLLKGNMMDEVVFEDERERERVKVTGYINELNNAFDKQEKALKNLKAFAKIFFYGTLCSILLPLIFVISNYNQPTNSDYPVLLSFLLFYTLTFPGGVIFCLICKAYRYYRYRPNKYGFVTTWHGCILTIIKVIIGYAAYGGCMFGPFLLIYYISDTYNLSELSSNLSCVALLSIAPLYILLLIGLLINWLIKNSKYKKLRDSIISKLSASEKIEFNDIIKKTESAIRPIPISINTDKGSFTFLE